MVSVDVDLVCARRTVVMVHLAVRNVEKVQLVRLWLVDAVRERGGSGSDVSHSTPPPCKLLLVPRRWRDQLYAG